MRRIAPRPGLWTAILAISALLLAACQAENTAWYPKGKATLSSFYEQTEETTKACILGVKIENTGDSTISASTVSLEVATGARSYFTTIVSGNTILPRGAIYLSASLSYADASETSSAGAVTVVSEFYE